MSKFLHKDNNNDTKAIIAELRILSKNSQAENALKTDW